MSKRREAQEAPQRHASWQSRSAYWRLLAGGPGALRLSPVVLTAMAGGGTCLLGVSAVVLRADGLGAGGILGPAVIGSIVIAAGTAVLVSALSARWFGARLGVLAGVVQFTSLYMLRAGRCAPGELLFGAATAAALGVFAVANVPGKLPIIERRWTRCVFAAAAGISFMVGGAAGPVLVLAGCLSYMAISGDLRSRWFFFDPVAIAILVVLVLLGLALPVGWGAARALAFDSASASPSPREVFSAVLVGSLPWTPLIVLAVAIGIRQGHYATPIWRFLACWAFGPMLLIATGFFRDAAYLGVLLPPLAVMGAAGLAEVVSWCSRRW